MGKNASTTYRTFLLEKTTSGSTTTYTKIIDIRDYSDTEGDPEMLDTSTLSDRTATGIPGQASMNTNTYTVLYHPTTYAALEALDDDEDHDFCLAFGAEEDTTPGKFKKVGKDGAVEWSGRLSCKILGGGFNEVRQAQITISSTTSPEWVNSLEAKSITAEIDFLTSST